MIRATLLAALTLAGACSLNAQHREEAVRIIVRWETPYAPVEALVQRVQLELGARVQYVRPMSGDAHVLLVDPLDADKLDAALQRLSAQPDIRYAVREARRVAH